MRRSMIGTGLFGGLMLLLAMASFASAATLKVTNTNDSGAGSLRAAIRWANHLVGFDTIGIRAIGTIHLQTQLPDITETVTIVGPAAGRIAVDGGKDPNNPYDNLNVFRTTGMLTGPVELRRITIAHGWIGIWNDSSGGTVHVVQTDVRDCWHGGIENEAGVLTVRGSNVTSNYGGYEGGGIRNDNAGRLTVSNSAVRHNSAGAYGGGIWNGGNLTLVRSTVDGNYADLGGGGLYNEHKDYLVGRLTVTASTVSNNTAAYGGGITNSLGTTDLSRSTIGGNGALTQEGGGISNYLGDVFISQSTIAANYASRSPTGIYNYYDSGDGRTWLQSTVLAQHTQTTSGANCGAWVTSNGFNLADDGTCNLTAQGDQANTDPLLRSLDAYGGPTRTFALSKTSLAVDAGFSGTAPTDQRGKPRIVDYPGVPKAAGGDNSDIGSFELQAPMP